MKNKILSILLVFTTFMVASAQEPKNMLYQGGTLPIPKPVFGEYTVGDDYFLANHKQLLQYVDQIAKVSDRIKVEQVGTSTEGRPFYLMIISSPENLKNIEEYRQISVKLAKAEGLTDDQARQLASKGKAVVWLDGGLHATEVINSQALFVQLWDLLSRNDEETLRILDNVVVLLSLINPDGMDLVSDWYMQESDPAKRNTRIPVMYQKYAGHDNNRDSYMANLKETEIINRLQFIDWIPQIVYNQHQTGPTGTVLFVSPIRDPFNHNQDPLVHLGVDLVGTAIHHRFLAEGKGGAVKREAASYSTWYNGGVRTTVGFHNQIGLIHEIIGSPTPISIPVVTNFLVPVPNNPLPIGPQQTWHQYQSIEYVITANRAVLDLAARQGDELLYRIYRAGKNSIERGNRDYWTVTPKWIDKLSADIAASRSTPANQGAQNFEGARAPQQSGVANELYNKMFKPENRDPRGYILSADQIDFPTATKFIHALQKTGVDVHRATSSFTVNGKTYPAGSYVLKADQAFRPHLRDMLEPQDHPNDFQYPGGPPIRPYDAAGWTLAYQMDVQVDPILDAFNGPFEKIEGLAKTPAGKITGSSNPAGYLLSHQINDAFVATTKLLEAKEEVYWLKEPFTVNGKTHPEGTIYIPAKGSTTAQIQKLANEVGLNFDAISAKPKGNALKLRPVKVALWDTYGGSMPSGWIRWIFDQGFSFSSYEVVYPAALDAGNLRSKYDVIILPPGAFSMNTGAPRAMDNIPAKYSHMFGSVTPNVTGPQLRKFVEEGGTILSIGSSTAIGTYFDLPISNALVELQADGTERPLGSDKYFIPGSVLRTKVNNTIPIAYGVSEDLDIIFGNNPVFRMQPDAANKGVKSVSWFPNKEPLRSGWAWGQHYLNGGTSIVEAKVGKGNLFLFGYEITYRAQSHGSFKFLFNGIYYSGATPVELK